MSARACVPNPSRVLPQETYGFLYLEYGPTAWGWEVEELVRKLLLSALVVLIDAGSPLQVSHCLKVLKPPALLLKNTFEVDAFYSLP